MILDEKFYSLVLIYPIREYAMNDNICHHQLVYKKIWDVAYKKSGSPSNIWGPVAPPSRRSVLVDILVDKALFVYVSFLLRRSTTVS